MTTKASAAPSAGKAQTDTPPREVHVDLDFPIPIEGVMVHRVTLKRLTMKGRLDITRTNPNMSVDEREAKMFEALTSLTEANIGDLDEKDYKKIQDAFVKMSERKPQPGYDDKPNPEIEHVLTLLYPTIIGGAQQTTLTIRRPKVKDRLLIARQYPNLSELEREAKLIANLCMISPDEMEQMDTVDYDNVIVEFRRFTISETPKA